MADTAAPDKSARKDNLSSRLLAKPWIKYGLGGLLVGSAAIFAGAGLGEWTSRHQRRYFTLLEQSLRQYADVNSDNIVTSAERDQFQIGFAKSNGLTYTSGFFYRHSDGRQISIEELNEMLSRYIEARSKE